MFRQGKQEKLLLTLAGFRKFTVNQSYFIAEILTLIHLAAQGTLSSLVQAYKTYESKRGTSIQQK